jgi:hypothetical protein
MKFETNRKLDQEEHNLKKIVRNNIFPLKIAV